MQLLTNKNILVACTGSIAVYKTLELIRLYIKAGANVKVIMSQSAKKFVTPLAFETISQQNILDDTYENWNKNSIDNHIAIGKWADILIIAPATANTINKLSHGIANNILLETVLAYPRIKLLCPAANTNMINNPITKESLQTLQNCNFKIIQSQVKELACRDIGDGAMANIEDIYHATLKELLSHSYWLNRKVVVTGGGTIEKIDDVRYISNFSSGKMAANLATALYYKGADVYFITTKHLDIPKEIKVIDVQNTKEMFRSVQKSLKDIKTEKKPYFFSVAAVSDYIPSTPKNGKLKKADIGKVWSLQLKKNRDILDSIDKKGIYTVGFKAELDSSIAQENAINMLHNKKIDAVCLNLINKENHFGSSTNEIDLISHNSITHIPKNSKLNISFSILNSLKEQFHD
ncbi:MAG: bifunctional phosphopantothenoylcysteine decarboxylase/phosphopantothenate--cysteine ligase CoaBC [Arcobacter sp.]|nr:MAG: bifunctional phosphopantothenoylcysteine decarboxylase/phosphopantothenate--cysteine ligase CoaBC [Arcobacter sp.]